MLIEHPKPILIVYEPPEDWKINPPDKDGEHVNGFAKDGYKLCSVDPKAFSKEARRQWNAMNQAHERHGAIIVRMPFFNGPQEGMVYTADTFLSLITPPKGTLKIIFSSLSNLKRVDEIAFYQDYFRNNYPHAVTMVSPYRTEGTGDNVYDPYRDIFWSGYAADPVGGKPSDGRSDIRAHKEIERFMGVEVVSLQVKAPFHHTDTSLGPLTYGHILCYPGGLQPESFERFKKRAFDDFNLDPEEYMIEVGEEDARRRFACNLRCIGNTVFMSECSKQLIERIESKGYKVVPLELSCFIAAGGGDHCTGNNINETRIPGGYIRQAGNLIWEPG
jgi:N-dimethylarginine dimethylaminohydrolase